MNELCNLQIGNNVQYGIYGASAESVCFDNHLFHRIAETAGAFVSFLM